jgi:hypothetical protein
MGNGSNGLTPYPAQISTGPRASTAAAWGGNGGNGGAMTGMVGGVSAAAAAAMLMIFLWYSLPR